MLFSRRRRRQTVQMCTFVVITQGPNKSHTKLKPSLFYGIIACTSACTSQTARSARTTLWHTNRDAAQQNAIPMKLNGNYYYVHTKARAPSRRNRFFFSRFLSLFVLPSDRLCADKIDAAGKCVRLILCAYQALALTITSIHQNFLSKDASSLNTIFRNATQTIYSMADIRWQ